MKYLHIAGYSEKGGFAIRFCGVPQIKSYYSNRIEILISGFCKETMYNKKMLNTLIDISKEMNGIVKNEERALPNRTQIKKEYEPILHEMLKNEGTLKKSLLDYYEQRKNIEVFEIKK